MSKLKVLFMGTPDFAVPTLETLCNSNYDVVGVVTQPDKPKGRGKAMQYTPIKEVALKYNIPVFQPIKLRQDECVEDFKKMDIDFIVVVAFGQILPKEILDMPRYGCINVHSSLLPRYRGAAPIQWTIINGEKETGITTMFMDEGLDTGDILLQERTPITREDTGGTLHDRLANMGAGLLMKTLAGIAEGNIERIKQNDEESNYVGMLNKSHGRIDFSKKACEIELLIRGLNPWPSAFTTLDGKGFKIWKSDIVATKDNDSRVTEDMFKAPVGQIVYVDKSSMLVNTAEGLLDLQEVQLEGKKRMMIEDFLRGFKVSVGTILG
ncbi:MAG: methionyl-tRNA formyltransferase [Lachnospiraceae bacterium]|nr:methionyl-tRNA formyltransferase [Lachnospiraceae bacterium]